MAQNHVKEKYKNLKFINKSYDINEIINNFSKIYEEDEILVITDKYNYENTIKIVPQNCNVVLCEGASIDFAEQVRKQNEYDRVIAIGGCSALDVGRFCGLYAKKEKSIISVPSILSTSCITANKAILYDINRNKKTIKTHISMPTIIPMYTIKNTREKDLIKWNSSGIGDMLAHISAVLDYLFLKDFLSKSIDIYMYMHEFFKSTNIINIVKVAEELHNVTANQDLRYIHKDENFLRKLATWLHSASILSNECEHIAKGGEHDFFYSIFKLKKYSTELPTHGQLVAIGTLIVAKIVSKYYKQDEIYNLLRIVYKSIGLPTNLSDLEKIKVDIVDIEEAIEKIEGRSLLKTYFDKKILNEVFNSEN